MHKNTLIQNCKSFQKDRIKNLITESGTALVTALINNSKHVIKIKMKPHANMSFNNDFKPSDNFTFKISIFFIIKFNLAF